MINELDGLKRDYQDIKAPPHLATRIQASVAERPARTLGWLPAAATAIVATAAVWIFPIAWQGAAVDVPTPARPSLSTLATLKPVKPPGVAPSLSRIQSVPRPQMPAKPKPARPQSNIHIDHEILKENDDALI